MQFKELAVTNYGNIKSAKIDLDYKGLTFIFGKNKDAGPEATNGAGKSQFWTAIPEIAYGTPPTGKDGHKHKNSEISLSIKVGDTLYQFKENFSKTGSKAYTVLKNGKDVNIRGVDYTQTKLQKFLGRTEEDFYTNIYVDSLKVHPLINGTAAQRQEFFVRAFNLENIDRIRKLLLAELSAVQKVAAKFREVKAVFETTKDQLKTTSEERQRLNERIEILQKERNSLLAKVEEVQTWRDLISFERDNSKLIEKFNATTSVETFEDDWAAAKAKRKKLKAARAAADEWRAYRKLYKAYKEETETLAKKVTDLLGKAVEPDLLKAKAASYESARKDLEVEKRALKDYQSQLEDVEEVDKPKHTLEEAQRQVTRLTDELQHVHEFKNGKCPTCGSTVKGRSKEEVKEDLTKWQARLKKVKTYDRYVESKAKNDKVKVKIRKCKEEIERLESVVAKTEKYAEAYRLTERAPELPTKPDSEEVDTTNLDDDLEKVNRKLSMFEAAEQVIGRIRSLKKLTKERRARVKGFDGISTHLNALNTKLSKLEAFKVQQDEIVKQLETLRSRGKVLKRQSEEEPILKALVKAYSAQGAKKLMIQRRAALLERQVNKFVRFTFNEDFTFEFKYDKKLEVLVHRKYGKKVQTTDVKRLSGAEKKMFTLLLVVARYTMTPKKQRSNLLILDELEANMGPQAVENFLKALPILNKIIPHIVVVTPRPELMVEGARCFTAIKHKGVTTLVEGRK